MEQNGQNNNCPQNPFGYDKATFDQSSNNNICTASTMDDNPNLPLSDNAFTMSFFQNASAAQNNDEGPSNSDVGDPGSTVINNTPSSNPPLNESSQNSTVGGPHRGSARGMQAAHTVGPIRTTAARGMATTHPYPRPQPVRSQAQVESLQAQRGLSRRNAGGDMAQQNGTNAYTLPRNRPLPAQPQAQQDISHTIASTINQIDASSTSSSVLPLTSSTVNTQALGTGGTPPAKPKPKTKRVYYQLDSSRIDPAGPEIHPNPDWRAPGPTHWDMFLDNHTLLVYLTDSGIKDVLKYCDRLVRNGVKDPSNPNGPALIGNRGFTVLDAQQVWNDCTAYTKRRQQLRNNSAASRSRNNKAAQLKHWKALALAAGATDRDFTFDKNDPGNAPGAPPTLLAAVTQAAMTEMMTNWASTTGTGCQGSMAVTPPGHVSDQPLQSLNLLQTQQPLYGQPQQQVYDDPQSVEPSSIGGLDFPSQNDALPVVSTPQAMAATLSTTRPPAYVAAPPSTAAAPDSTASDFIDAYQPDFEVDMDQATAEHLQEFQAFSGQETYTEDLDFDFDFSVGNL